MENVNKIYRKFLENSRKIKRKFTEILIEKFKKFYDKLEVILRDRIL